MRKYAVALTFLLVVSACGGSSDTATPATTVAPVATQVPTTTAAPATTTVAPLPLVDLVANYHAQDFLPVPMDFAKEVRQAGLLPLRAYNFVDPTKNEPGPEMFMDPEFRWMGGPWMAGEFCPGLSWMGAGLNNKKVSIQRMVSDWNTVVENSGDVVVHAVTVTAIHDVDANEFASALDTISIATGGNGECAATAQWASGSGGEAIPKFSVVELRGADLDTDRHKIRIAPFVSHPGKEYPIVRGVGFDEMEYWSSIYRGGEFALSHGNNEERLYVEWQVLLHLEPSSTVLHIHTWAVHERISLEDATREEFLALIETVNDFGTNIIDPTVSKLMTFAMFHQAQGE